MPQVVMAAEAAFTAVATWVAGAATAVGATVGLSAAASVATAKFLFEALAVAAISKPGKLKSAGSQLQFKADTAAGIPIVFGRTAVGGNCVFQYPSGPTNNYLNQIVVLSGGGPIEAVEAFYANQVLTTFNNSTGAVTNSPSWSQRMWQKVALGALAAAALTQPSVPAAAGPLTQWGSANKLSGYAHAYYVQEYDTNIYSSGMPTPMWVVKGIKCYDPRLDSTYPGGSGPQRANDPTTWAWSQNPYVLGLTWCLGLWQNGKRVAGVGIPASMIDMSGFVDGSNVADANGWTAGGQVTTLDSKWGVLKALLKAGGGEPIQTGAKLSCRVSTPRTALATISSDDLAGGSSIVPMRSRRDRINSIVPTCRLEANNWLQVPLAPVTSTVYQAFDGGLRQSSVTYDLVQNAAQAAQIAAYDVADAREFTPITLQLKPRFMGFRPGDCLNINIPETGLNNQKALVTSRTGPDVKTGIVTLVLVSETDGKHAYALGQTGTPPPTASLTLPDFATVAAPLSGQWSVAASSFTGGGTAVPCLAITGSASDNNFCEEVVFEFKKHTDTDWLTWGTAPFWAPGITIVGVAGSTSYDVAVSYKSIYGITGARRILGPVTSTAGYGIASTIVNQGDLATLNQATWATQITGVGKPDDYANKSLVYRQMSAPTSATVNDIWVQIDGSGNPLAVYAFNGSSWIKGADLTGLNIAAGFDGSGDLAYQNLADWGTQVSGSGKPADNADVTGSNIAAGFTGAGGLAYLNSVGLGTIDSNSVDGAQLVVNAANLVGLNTGSSLSGAGAGVWQTAATVTFTLAEDGWVIADAITVGGFIAPLSYFLGFDLQIDGNSHPSGFFTGSTAAQLISLCTRHPRYCTAGTHTATLYWYGSTNMSSTSTITLEARPKTS